MEFYVIAAVTYLLFVFLAEQLNPFGRPKAYFSKRKLKFGLGCSLAFLACAIAASLLIRNSLIIQIGVTILGSALLSIPSILLFKDSSQQNKLKSKEYGTNP